MMRYFRMLGASILAAAMVVAPVVAGAQGSTGKKAEPGEPQRVTEEAKRVTQEAKTAISDSWITAKTKIALFADDRVKGTQVSVETTKGMVALRGKVDSEEAKTAAVAIAHGIEGVRGVQNDVQVVAPAVRKTVDVSDKDITRQVEDRLARDKQLKGVSARTDAGVVILTGEVPTLTASARASEMAHRVPGVRAVKNDLTEKPSAKR